MGEIVLYVTEACSLCDEALDMLLSSKELSGHILTTVDIVSDEDLVDRLGQKIPVLSVDGVEICWPFDIQQISTLLERK